MVKSVDMGPMEEDDLLYLTLMRLVPEMDKNTEDTHHISLYSDDL